MKNISTILILFISFSFNAQRDLNQSLAPLQNKLQNWDVNKGAWLSQAIKSYAVKETLPARTFVEQHSLNEAMAFLPDDIANTFDSTVRSELKQNPQSPEWQRLNALNQRRNCTPRSGRSFGDPHMVSYDGVSYSFQTAGEFVLSQSSDKSFVVQTRQRPQTDEFSLNTAVAMNVNGDRVAIYANEKPDDFGGALRVNGAPTIVPNQVIYLERGGVIRYVENQYQVTWPTGEKLVAEVRRTGGMGFLNLTLQSYPCADQVGGLLGNGNGVSNDDFNGKDPQRNATFASMGIFSNDELERASRATEQAYLTFLAQDFADQWRILQEESLFDYAAGESTLTYTDRSFPRIHRSIHDLDENRRNQAMNECRRAGVPAHELRGCAFDNGFMNIPPSPKPRVIDLGDRSNPTTGGAFTGGGPKKPVTDGDVLNPRKGADVQNPAEPEINNPGSKKGVYNDDKPVKPNMENNGVDVKPSTPPVKVTNDKPVKPSAPSVNPTIKNPVTPKPNVSKPPVSTPTQKPVTNPGTTPIRRP